jgi:hypothetical protein
MQSLSDIDAPLVLLSAIANQWATDARRGDANALETLARWLDVEPETLARRLDAQRPPTRQTLRLR